ncbi:hypothetical protein T484DRAFT_1755099 [Baffinella frigidus]|nr:hypothetical protein T484DRAFT_1755099 [Cryptophyta sp. CCMP2293]
MSDTGILAANTSVLARLRALQEQPEATNPTSVKKGGSNGVSVTISKKDARKNDRKTTKKAQEKLSAFCKCFTRGYELEVTREVDIDEVGVLEYQDKDQKIACPLTVMQYLIDNDELHSSSDESGAKCFCEDEYGPISDFPMQLEQLAAKFLEGAKLAREAGIDKVKCGDEADESELTTEDGDVEPEDEDDESEDDE